MAFYHNLHDLLAQYSTMLYRHNRTSVWQPGCMACTTYLCKIHVMQIPIIAEMESINNSDKPVIGGMNFGTDALQLNDSTRIYMYEKQLQFITL